MEDKLGYREAPGSLLGPLPEPFLGIPSTAQEAYHVCIITYKLREVWGLDASENRTFRNKIPSKTTPQELWSPLGTGSMEPKATWVLQATLDQRTQEKGLEGRQVSLGWSRATVLKLPS